MKYEIKHKSFRNKLDSISPITTIECEEFYQSNGFFEFWLKGDRSPIYTLAIDEVVSIRLEHN